jgi:cysteine desulfurase
MVIKGIAQTYAKKGKHIITSQIEHPAIINPCKFLEKNGYNVTYVPVDNYGIVSAADIEKAITPETILVTIMHANNETGTIQPIEEISKICKRRQVFFHTDASQSVGKIPADVSSLGVDFLTLAGHKLYAPKGVGALYIRKGIEIEPLIHGANQESGRRGGTENVIFAAGLGKACEIAAEKLGSNTTLELTNSFYNGLKNIFGEDLVLYGHPEKKLPNTLFVSFLGHSLSDVIKVLPNVAFSTGSACHSDSTEISPVLKAMKISTKHVSATIRFSLGRYTTTEEIETTLRMLRKLY